jgi:hypothetical protein
LARGLPVIPARDVAICDLLEVDMGIGIRCPVDWIVGRILYFLGYLAAPQKRFPGCFIQTTAAFVMSLGALGRNYLSGELFVVGDPYTAHCAYSALSNGIGAAEPLSQGYRISIMLLLIGWELKNR